MKIKKIFVCSVCGAISPKWSGKCSSCESWDSLVEEIVTKESKNLHSNSSVLVASKKLGNITSQENFRYITGIDELDRVLGGGIVPGSLVLVGGDPGIGKSTLMMQMLARLFDYEPLYVTGEESENQVKYRSERIKDFASKEVQENFSLLAENNLEVILNAIQHSNSRVIVIDSIQSVYSDKVDSLPGSINQIRETTNALMHICKKMGKAIFIIGHVTKDGSIAGPKVLEHMVDTVLQFEGEKTYSYRILRSLKNRYGSTNEIGIFDMTEEGMVEVKNPSEIFLSARIKNESGISIVSSIEGSRPILLELQTLVTPTSFAVPQRTTNGFDLRRLQMIIAVLEKRLGMKFFKNDIFVNVAGGVNIFDSSVDLGLAAALISSYNDQAIDSTTAFVGEIGLTGEVRNIANCESRIKEAEKLGFENFILPKTSYDKLTKKFKINLKPIERISNLFTVLNFN